MGWSCYGLITERDARNLRIFNYWMLSAVICFAAGTILMGAKVIPPGALALTIPAAVAILGVIAIRAYLIFLREADELLRKIQLEALALGFGTGALSMLVWRLCERAGAPKLDFADPFLIMTVAWAVGQWLGMRRYGTGEPK